MGLSIKNSFPRGIGVCRGVLPILAFSYFRLLRVFGIELIRRVRRFRLSFENKIDFVSLHEVIEAIGRQIDVSVEEVDSYLPPAS